MLHVTIYFVGNYNDKRFNPNNDWVNSHMDPYCTSEISPYIWLNKEKSMQNCISKWDDVAWKIIIDFIRDIISLKDKDFRRSIVSLLFHRLENSSDICKCLYRFSILGLRACNIYLDVVTTII